MEPDLFGELLAKGGVAGLLVGALLLGAWKAIPLALKSFEKSLDKQQTSFSDSLEKQRSDFKEIITSQQIRFTEESKAQRAADNLNLERMISTIKDMRAA